MALLSVRALPDRVAYDAPRGGKKIPSDQYVPVPDNAYIRRLINHWGDIEVEGADSVEPTATPIEVPEKPVEAQPPVNDKPPLVDTPAAIETPPPPPPDQTP